MSLYCFLGFFLIKKYCSIKVLTESIKSLLSNRSSQIKKKFLEILLLHTHVRNIFCVELSSSLYFSFLPSLKPIWQPQTPY